MLPTLLAACLVLAAPTAGPPLPAPQDGAAGEAAALAAGRRALEGGDLDAARAQLLIAFAQGAPRSDVAELLLEVERQAGDEDARLAWAHGWALAVADANGRLPRAPRGLLPDAPWLADVTRRRAAAVSELVQAATKRSRAAARSPHELLVAAWLRRAALDLAQPMPAVLAGAGDGLDPTVHAPRDAHVDLLGDLERLAESALTNGRVGESIRAARVVHGLGVQADFGALDGPRPGGMARWRAKGADLLRRARARLAAEHPDPWTVEELEWLTGEEGEAFTRQHASFALPGVAVSPRGWYRVESDCGYETLLGVARTIELHHARLAEHFGVDPFAPGGEVERQGLVRIVPGADGLEAEGAPFFWAGGFQAGDLTVVRFSVGSIEGLGRALTHELTHRFDGALHAGLPSWLAEGRAVWTGGAYGHSSDEAFVPHHVNFGTLLQVRGQGYGAAVRLGKLVSGAPPDYRDNYSAGYALYVYLETAPPTSFEGAAPLFRAQLRAFEEAGPVEAGAPQRARFEEYFCDGADGRPASLEAFTAGFAEFLDGFDRREPAPWLAAYLDRVPAPTGPDWVYDSPTWVWSWERAEPTFGQDQARQAGDLLLELGRREEAAAAYAWARSQDGLAPRTNRALLAALEGVKRSADARWVAAAELAFPGWTAESAAPFLADLRATRGLLEAYAAAAAATELPLARAVLAAEHDRLARWFGAPELGAAAVASPAASPAEGPPLDRPAFALAGWTDGRLAGLDRDRPERAWAALEGGELLVGRRAERSGTGRFDRGGGERAFALAEPWLLPGRYRVGARVRFTTGYNEVEVVLGYTRRDRCVRLRLVAGSFLFAIGEDDEEPTFDEVRWSLGGRRERDAGLPGARPRGAHDLGRSAVDVELLVDGATVTAYLDGEEVGSYHTIDGAPIEGRVGFGARAGAVLVERPEAQRLDRGVHAGAALRRPRGVDLDRAVAPPFDGLVNLPLRGLAPSTTGRLVLWVPAPEPGSDSSDPERLVSRTERQLERFSERVLRADALQPRTAIVPASLGAERVAQLAAFGADLPAPVEVRTHALVTGPDEDAPDRARRWFLFLDAAGVVRVALPWVDGAALRNVTAEHWMTVFRDNGAPPRDLPPVARGGDDAEDG